jgi:hypothetical protein
MPLTITAKELLTKTGGGAGHEISVSSASKLLTAAGFKINTVLKKVMLWYPHYTITCFK